MNISIGDKVLITTDNWFYAPDGGTYRAVFGTVRGVHNDEATLGIKTNMRSTNWYLEIGNITLAGFQIHYAVRTDRCNKGRAQHWQTSAADGCKEMDAPSSIYFADEEFFGETAQ